MAQLPYLQPFDDVNKRVSRLAANIPFIKRNLSPLSFTDVPRKLYNEAMLSHTLFQHSTCLTGLHPGVPRSAGSSRFR
jgi:Fic family protein